MRAIAIVCLMVSLTAVLSTSAAPAIGILAMPSNLHPKYPADQYNYLIASYVKWVEAGGARVVPVQYDLPLEELNTLLRGLNGMLFPCGVDTFVTEDNVTPTPYMKVVGNIIDIVTQINDEGTHYPLLGLGVGFRAIACTFVGRNGGSFNCVKEIDNFFLSPKPIGFYEGALESPIFAGLNEHLKDALTQSKTSFFNAKKVVENSLWTNNAGLTENFDLLAYALDNENNKVPAIIAHKDYPIYGIQPLPEKVAYEWSMPYIPHTPEAVQITQSYSLFFSNEARQNNNDMNADKLNSMVAFNFQPEATYKAYIDQIYFFKNQKSSVEAQLAF